jgi:hypothetical protein
MVHDLSFGDLASGLPHDKRYRYLSCLLMRKPAKGITIIAAKNSTDNDC